MTLLNHPHKKVLPSKRPESLDVALHLLYVGFYKAS